jgi:hypothetical protein
VIVNDGNSRFFESGPGRKFLLGLEAQRRFWGDFLQLGQAGILLRQRDRVISRLTVLPR